MDTQEKIELALRDYYNSSTNYIKLIQKHSAEYFSTYLNLLAKPISTLPLSNRTLIELGCGAGISTFYIAQRFPEVECLGVDISTKNIDYAQKNYSLPNLKYEVADCANLKKPNEYFSIVTSFDLIEHLPSTETALEEMIRIVKDRGYIVIKFPNHMSPLIPILDILLVRYRYPFTPTWFHNFPRLFKLTRFFIYNLNSSTVTFTTRVPDLSDSKQIGRDADAVYEVSPLDLIKFFNKKRFQIKNVACPRKNAFLPRVYSKLFPLFASVGLVVRKVVSY